MMVVPRRPGNGGLDGDETGLVFGGSIGMDHGWWFRFWKVVKGNIGTQQHAYAIILGWDLKTGTDPTLAVGTEIGGYRYEIAGNHHGKEGCRQGRWTGCWNQGLDGSSLPGLLGPKE